MWTGAFFDTGSIVLIDAAKVDTLDMVSHSFLSTVVPHSVSLLTSLGLMDMGQILPMSTNSSPSSMTGNTINSVLHFLQVNGLSMGKS